MPSPKSRAAAAAPKRSIDASRIVERAPTPPKAPERNLEGRYRVIHGRHWFARPKSETHDADGVRIENVPPQVQAGPGDVVELTHEDAKLALLQGLVEEVDASPSRVGRVYEKDEPHDNSKQARARVAQNLHPHVRGMQPAAD